MLHPLQYGDAHRVVGVGERSGVERQEQNASAVAFEMTVEQRSPSVGRAFVADIPCEAQFAPRLEREQAPGAVRHVAWSCSEKIGHYRPRTPVTAKAEGGVGRYQEPVAPESEIRKKPPRRFVTHADAACEPQASRDSLPCPGAEFAPLTKTDQPCEGGFSEERGQPEGKQVEGGIEERGRILNQLPASDHHLVGP